MASNLGQNQSWMEQLAVKITNSMIEDNEENHLRYLKCKFGLETLLINLSKMAIVYGVALFAGVFVATLVFHSAYMLIRTYAYGCHLLSSFKCTIISCGMLVGIPFCMSQNMLFSSLFLFVIGGINFLLIYRYAPSSTKKNPIKGFERRQKLQRKALISNGICLLIAFACPNPLYTNLLVIGSFCACFMLTPIAYKLFT